MAEHGNLLPDLANVSGFVIATDHGKCLAVYTHVRNRNESKLFYSIPDQRILAGRKLVVLVERLGLSDWFDKRNDPGR
jgi:hypothetical protein